MQRKTKLTLLAVGALLSLTAAVGVSVFVARAANNESDSSSQKASSGSTHLPYLPDSSKSEEGSPSSGTSNPEESDDSSSSGSANPEIHDGPYITCDKQSMTLSVASNDTVMPYGYFTPEIRNASIDDGTYATKHLAICAPNDNGLLEWLDFKTYDADDHEVNAVSGSIVIVNSGKPVKMILKQKPPLAGGYQIRLRVYSPYYDSSLVRWFIDVNLQTTR